VFLVCMADLFAFNAEGNAFAEERVVISRVEKSNFVRHAVNLCRGVLPLVE